jgi:phospholipase C
MSVDQDAAAGLPPTQGTPLLGKIENFVVLMLENRSFDHLLGSLPNVDGVQKTPTNPDFEANSEQAPEIPVRPATSPVMPYDPNHEFADVDLQLSLEHQAGGMAPPMGGFITSAWEVANSTQDAYRIMEFFTPTQVPALAALAQEFAVCNYWHSSLPGPTFPNRFFVHACTSGGLTQSPAELAILAGFSFSGGTVYSKLEAAKKTWCIYHDGLPQSAAIGSLRLDYIDPFTKTFRKMEQFSTDVDQGNLPDYAFIEPDYDVNHNYEGGNSMHPRDDVRKGEALIKTVYEKLRNSGRYWGKVMLIVVFDEHGGFYDHIVPPAAIPPGGDAPNANPYAFKFDRLGVRVPAIIVSAYTKKGTVIGNDQQGDPIVFDHTSVYKTLAERFGLGFLTDRAAEATSLSVSLNQENPRMDGASALLTLPETAADTAFQGYKKEPDASSAATASPVSDSPHLQSMLGVALACEYASAKDPAQKEAVLGRRAKIGTQAEALQYIHGVDDTITAGRVQK